MFKRFFFGLFILLIISQNVAAAARTQLITLGGSSNIYAKTLLFYLPLTNPKLIDHSWTLHSADKTFDSIVTIDDDHIYDKPVIHDIFTSDFFLRIQQVPYISPDSRTVTLPVTIRLNQNIIERNVTFHIRYSNGKMRLIGKIDGLRIADIKGGDYYPKRQRWKIPLIIDLHYIIDRKV